VVYDTNGATALTSDGEVISISGLGVDGAVVTGSTISGDVFTMGLDPEAADCYIFTLIAPLDDGAGTLSVPLSDLTNSSADFKVLTLDSENGQDLLFSGYTRQINDDIAQATVNPSSGNSIGVANQAMNGTDVLAMDFVTDASAFKNGGQEAYDYGSHYDVNSFSLTIIQLQSAQAGMWIRVYDSTAIDPAGTNQSTHFDALLQGPGTQDTITDILVNGVSVNLASLTPDGTGGYYIDGLGLNDIVTVDTADGYSRIEIENPAASTLVYDIGAFTYEDVSSGDPIAFSFDTELTDGDGDTSSGVIDLAINPEADANVIEGSDFGDTLLGGGNDDTIIGGLGDDTLTGGTGADIFQWNLGDEGTNSTDTITDFNVGEGDVLDLTGLLGTVTPEDGATLDDYLSFFQDGLDTVVSVDVEGDGSGTDMTIVLENFDSAALGGSDAAIIDNLISTDSINTDGVL
ncbi:MAG: type I secretion C-terminal target domain-containing protein, partial [Porticoccus sp.]|nr:type I secretion C-terminal target domain-containing protein [Porticoccus sp.]